MSLHTEKPETIITGLATAAIIANRFIGFDDAVCNVRGEAAKGVSRDNGDNGKSFPMTTGGTALVEAGVALVAGADVTTDNAGKAIPAYSGETINGKVVRAQPLAGQLVEVKLNVAPLSTASTTTTTTTTTTTNQ